MIDNRIADLLESFTSGLKDSDLKNFYKLNKLTTIGNQVLKAKKVEILQSDAEGMQILKELLLIKLEEVEVILEKSKISFMLLKGLNLINQFPEYGLLRDIKDIDILIEITQLEKALEVLGTNGWKYKFPDNGVKRRLELLINHSVTLTDPNSGIELDLHWKLAEAFVCEQEFSKDYLITSTINQQSGYLYPKSEYQIVFLMIHAYKNSWQQLQSFIDLYCIMTRSDINFCKVLALAKKYQVELICIQTLELMDLLFGLKISPKKLSLDLDRAKDLLRKLSSRNDINKNMYFLKGNQKLKFIIYRYLLPFGPDLQNSSKLISILFKKHLRIIKNTIS